MRSGETSDSQVDKALSMGVDALLSEKVDGLLTAIYALNKESRIFFETVKAVPLQSSFIQPAFLFFFGIEETKSFLEGKLGAENVQLVETSRE